MSPSFVIKDETHKAFAPGSHVVTVIAPSQPGMVVGGIVLLEREAPATKRNPQVKQGKIVAVRDIPGLLPGLRAYTLAPLPKST